MSLQEDHTVSAEIKRFVSEIIAKHNFKETFEVKYSPGSQVGDGFATKTYAVEISDGETSLSLFLKCALDFGDNMPSSYIMYLNEIFFYKTVFPVYMDFWKKKGVEDGFRNVPRSYGFNEKKRSEIVALENLRKKGFTLFDRFTNMNDEHLNLIFRTFARFHAVSFALKDQRRDLHDEFCAKCPNYFAIETVFAKMVSNSCTEFISKLDSVEDADILSKCDGLESKAYDQIVNMDSYLTDDYSIFTKGDCWVNNMMILYENDDREHPKDIMLIDWQCIMRSSPVHDMGALFYSVASKETLDNYKYYLQVYHDELSKRIKELGSDPEVLYPRSVFEKQWKDYALYGLGFGLVLLKIMLCESGNLPTLEKKDMDKNELEHVFTNLVDNQAEYLMRAKYVVRHLIDIGAL